jgi:formate dehydrogenase subunit gamma
VSVTVLEESESHMRERERLVRAIAEQHRSERGPLMPVLHEVNDDLGYVAAEDVGVIADVLNLSRAEVRGVISFYPDFRTTPPPAHLIRLCRAEACQSVGAQALWDRVVASPPAGDAEVEQVFCLGNCALGPSGTVDGRLHGRLSQERLVELTRGWQG